MSKHDDIELENVAANVMRDINDVTDPERLRKLIKQSARRAELIVGMLEDRIVELEKVAAKAEALYNSIEIHHSGRKWVDHELIDELGFALCDLTKKG